MNAEEKKTLYRETAKEIAAVIDGEPNIIARMATVSNILHHAFEYFFWTGFYCVDFKKPSELVIGPYQGTMGCLRIPFGKGVCGTAAELEETQIVDDVHAYAGHISCDANSQSEIVIPVYDAHGKFIAVFDVDSDRPAMFDEDDAAELATILKESFEN